MDCLLNSMEYHNEMNNRKKLFLFLNRFSYKRYIFGPWYMHMNVCIYITKRPSQYKSISNGIYEAINREAYI